MQDGGRPYHDVGRLESSIDIKDLWARLKSVLIQVEFVKAFRPNSKAINKIELLKKYERQRYELVCFKVPM